MCHKKLVLQRVYRTPPEEEAQQSALRDSLFPRLRGPKPNKNNSTFVPSPVTPLSPFLDCDGRKSISDCVEQHFNAEKYVNCIARSPRETMAVLLQLWDTLLLPPSVLYRAVKMAWVAGRGRAKVCTDAMRQRRSAVAGPGHRVRKYNALHP